MQIRISAILVVAGLAAAAPALSQTHPQDGIDRNLQQRAAREQEFHVGLQDDNTLPPPRPIVPGKTGLQFYVPTPGSEILRHDEVRQPAPPARGAPGKSVVTGETLLQDSQSRRQMELQTQIQNRPEPERQQILQIQQLGFDRETSAQELGSKIMRDSSRALGAPR
jgi:hypothetical protein